MRIYLVIAFVASCVFSQSAFARGSHHGGGGHHSSSGATHVSSYTKKSGTHVQSHRRTNADGTRSNNWSHKGNINPDTGKMGHSK